MAFASRIGEMPVYSTVYNTLKGLAIWGFLRFDNVQNYTRQRDHRIGWVNKMNLRIAVTYCDIYLTAADLDDKIQRVAETSGEIL